jgi:hypothetical protein
MDKVVHFEIPADDTAKGREFWGSLFGWQFESYPGPFEYHMTRISDQAGLYLFPGMGVGDNPTKEQEEEAMKNYEGKLAKNPSGLLLYYPAGSRPMVMGKWLTVEFLKQLLVSILAVFLLAQTRIATYGGRVGFVFVVGIVAAVTTNVSYWNWYGFPGAYTVPYMTIEIVGFIFAGLAAALVCKSQKSEG